MKPYQLSYEFDDLYPLSVEARTPFGGKLPVELCCSVTGRADIEYGMSGDWSVSAIGIYFKSLISGEWVPHCLEESHPLYALIKSALDTKEATDIQRKVDAEIADIEADKATYRRTA